MGEVVPYMVLVEKGYNPPPRLRLSDEEYAHTLQATIQVTVDVVAINRKKRQFYLAMRQAKPVAGWWWFGGRQNPGETPTEAAVRIMKRETGLDLSSERFKFVAYIHHMCKDREQEPQDMGCHMLAGTFVFEPTEEELSCMKGQLEKKEYASEIALRPFGLSGLLAEGARPQVLQLYDKMFGIYP